MSWRPPSPKQRAALQGKLTAMRRAKDLARMQRPAPGYPPVLPALRRTVVVTDYDTGEPVVHELRLYKTRRVDTYRIEADGTAWRTGGWTVALLGLRKAYPRVPSPRSDIWDRAVAVAAPP
jgi:hypothetical protein